MNFNAFQANTYCLKYGQLTTAAKEFQKSALIKDKYSNSSIYSVFLI